MTLIENSSLDCGVIASTLQQTSGSTTPMNRLASTTRSDVEPGRLFARLPAVIQATGLGRSTIYRLVANGAFPRPVHLGPRAIAWRWSDLEQWSATRAEDHH
jgi:prophage regulatory protein